MCGEALPAADDVDGLARAVDGVVVVGVAGAAPGSAADGEIPVGRPTWWWEVGAVYPMYRSIVVFDVAGFGRLDNRAQLRVREALRGVVRGAFRAAGVRWWRLAVADRGDGLILVVPPSVSKAVLLDPLVPRLVAGLAARPEGVRLRMAVHAGDLDRDRHGWTGTDLVTACRLVDSPELYRRLADRPDADLVVVVSDAVHRAVVRQGYGGLRAADFDPVRVVLKEVDEQAWVHVPDPRAAVPTRLGGARVGE
ncbi:hypothetical protein GCM10010492_55010 [Saccharothrix mutabilis subsp. mutabilis]|uniref:Guanylate cyclase domain-containing protein n=1 Tax=Saccharothrix mutabilis subsp. mutabilis TaxID=66855 RepID=A0ABN0UEU1_9PSEU